MIHTLVFLDFLCFALYTYCLILQTAQLIKYARSEDKMQGSRIAFYIFNISVTSMIVSFILADTGFSNAVSWRIISRCFVVVAALIAVALYSGSDFKIFTSEYWKRKRG